MPTIVVQGTVIEFPENAQSPSWSEPIIEFAEAVEAALAGIVGTYDVSPRTFDLTDVPAATATDIPSLAFATSEVRGAFVKYSVYRTTSTADGAETGTLQLIYNPNNSVGELWEVAREAVGDATVTFACTDVGQVQITLTAMSGTGHAGSISYMATAIQQEY